ncbi:MAG: KdsC family phosphatase [Phycisphaerales bacterium]
MNLSQIKLLLLDVDGVMTDGSIYLDADGREIKRFHVRDGLGIKAAQHSGLIVAILSSRHSEATTRRAKELGIDFVSQGQHDKLIGFEDLCARLRIDPDEVAYMGDDLQDLPVLMRVGFPMTVADAAPEVKEVAKYVTTVCGGQGAVRQAVEHLLKATGKWEAVLDQYGL